MQHPCAVDIQGLTKRYRTSAVINSLTLCIKQGEVVGVLGPNGAGKSTLMRMLVGAMKPTSGQIRIFGKLVGRTPNYATGSDICRRIAHFRTF